MAQMPLGPNAKSVVKSTRMTRTQEKILERKFGSAQNALKQFVHEQTREELSAGSAK